MAFTAGVATLFSAGLGAYSSIRQSRAQARQAEAQADIARQNQELAQDQASAQRREGYENMTRKRQEVAGIVARQRAMGGASGAQVDTGGLLDLNLDSREQGEMDALNLYQQGLDQAWNSEMQAWNYGNQASAYSAQASSARKAGLWDAGSTLIGGIASAGSQFGRARETVSAAKSADVKMPWYGVLFD